MGPVVREEGAKGDRGSVMSGTESLLVSRRSAWPAVPAQVRSGLRSLESMATAGQVNWGPSVLWGFLKNCAAQKAACLANCPREIDEAGVQAHMLGERWCDPEVGCRRVGAVGDTGCVVSCMGWKNRAAMAAKSGGSSPKTRKWREEVVA